MITYEDALKKFEGETMEIMPTDQKRICIPIHNHVGSHEEEFTSWDGSKQKVVGYKFANENDESEQVASAKDGVLMCYEGKTPDGKDRSEAIKEYLDKHPLAAKTKGGVEKLVAFMNEATKEWREKKDPITGKTEKKLLGDVYSTDLNFVSKKVLGAPAKDDIVPGQMIVGQKVQSTLQAIKVAEGVEFEGAPGTASTQKAGKGGAYIIKDDSGARMIQAKEFNEAYVITKMPKGVSRNYVNE